MRNRSRSHFAIFMACILIQALTLQTVMTGCKTRNFESSVKGDDLEKDSVAASMGTVFTGIATQQELQQRLKQANCPTKPTPIDPAFLSRELRYNAARVLLLTCLALPFWVFSGARDAARQNDGMKMGIPSIENVTSGLDALNKKGNLSAAEEEERTKLSNQLDEFNNHVDGAPSGFATTMFVVSGIAGLVVFGFVGKPLVKDSNSRKRGDTTRLVGEVWNRINAESLARAKRKQIEKDLKEQSLALRESVQELFDLIDSDTSVVVPMVNTSAEGIGSSETRFVLAPSYIRADFLGGQSVDMQKIRAAISNWPQGLPRIEMIVGYNKSSDVVTGDLILVHPGGLVSEPILRIQVDGLLDPTVENSKHRRMSSALQTASVRGGVSDEGMKDLVTNYLPNVFQALLTQMAYSREIGRGNKDLQSQTPQGNLLPQGLGMPVSFGTDGGVVLGNKVPLPVELKQFQRP
jgi:hypothetical protein